MVSPQHNVLGAIHARFERGRGLAQRSQITSAQQGRLRECENRGSKVPKI